MDPTEALSLLASSERRHVLAELGEGGGTTVEELSQQIAVGDGERSSKGVEYIKIQLVHIHLPRLEAYGAIEYDDRTGDVQLTHTGEWLKPILEATRRSATTSP